MAPWLLIAIVLLVAVLAPHFGADSRDGQDWKRRH
jgi:hypothetical protein